VAETTFSPGLGLCRVPVATPSAPVAPGGWVKVLPPPVAWSATVAPSTGSPASSRTVTVIVEVPVTASIEAGSAEMVERPALGPLHPHHPPRSP
jgi:hypothetical protein